MRRLIWFRDLVERKELLAAALAVSLALDLVLGVALAVKALQRRPVLVLPIDTEATPGEISDEAALAFARLYVVTFDTYTPATLPASTEWLKKRIAPRTWSKAAEALDRRLDVVREGRMSSLVVPLEEGSVDRRAGIVAVIRARRTIYVADALSRQAAAIYRLTLEPAAATPGNPSGIAVVSQTVEEEQDENAR
ncbi:MAG: hypothetical protein HY716_17560 [Planctomycetes bacterium]|nr:hypothetical protein [Planctomycetota bacterium]